MRSRHDLSDPLQYSNLMITVASPPRRFFVQLLVLRNQGPNYSSVLHSHVTLFGLCSIDDAVFLTRYLFQNATVLEFVFYLCNKKSSNHKFMLGSVFFLICVICVLDSDRLTSLLCMTQHNGAFSHSKIVVRITISVFRNVSN